METAIIFGIFGQEGGYLPAVLSRKGSGDAGAFCASLQALGICGRAFRPAEVETLLGDPTKARERLGWEPRISVEEMVAEMARADLREAERDMLCKNHGFTPGAREG